MKITKEITVVFDDTEFAFLKELLNCCRNIPTNKDSLNEDTKVFNQFRWMNNTAQDIWMKMFLAEEEE